MKDRNQQTDATILTRKEITSLLNSDEHTNVIFQQILASHRALTEKFAAAQSTIAELKVAMMLALQNTFDIDTEDWGPEDGPEILKDRERVANILEAALAAHPDPSEGGSG